MATIGHMDTVSVAELKDKLSEQLRRVRRGEALLIRDRNEVIARIEPVATGTFGSVAENLQNLEQRGIVTLAKTKLDLSLLTERPAVHIDLLKVLLQERETGR